MPDAFGLARRAPAADHGLDHGRLDRLDRHFRAHVDRGHLLFVQLAVTRHGRLVHVTSQGKRDVEAGLVELTDPIAKFIAAFADARVFAGGSSDQPVTVPAQRPIRV